MSGNKGKKDCSKCIHYGGDVGCGGVLCKLVNAVVYQSKLQAGFNRCAYRVWSDGNRREIALSLIAEARQVRVSTFSGALTSHMSF